MKREFKRKKSKHLFIASAFLLMIISLCGGFAYLYHFAPERLHVVTQSVSRLQIWLNKRQAHLNKNITHIKQAAAERLDTHPKIQFQFYRTLPDMAVRPPQRPDQQNNEIEVVTVKEVAATKPIFDAEQIQRSFNEELMGKQ